MLASNFYNSALKQKLSGVDYNIVDKAINDTAASKTLSMEQVYINVKQTQFNR